jgi:hypothetical protein
MSRTIWRRILWMSTVAAIFNSSGGCAEAELSRAAAFGRCRRRARGATDNSRKPISAGAGRRSAVPRHSG